MTTKDSSFEEFLATLMTHHERQLLGLPVDRRHAVLLVECFGYSGQLHLYHR